MRPPSRTPLLVYPRTRGETPQCRPVETDPTGLSPHARGNPEGRHSIVQSIGSIPARAGKPDVRRRDVGVGGVYPRTRGETPRSRDVHESPVGLSPHARGNHIYRLQKLAPGGSIPARAGKPVAMSRTACRSRVYPRTRGETRAAQVGTRTSTGLSPHARGNPMAELRTLPHSGSIPARAGKPAAHRRSGGLSRVYPRTRGETEHGVGLVVVDYGLSPHARGNLQLPDWHRSPAGSIPARAGKPSLHGSGKRCTRVYPRTRGETMPYDRLIRWTSGLSPHARGNQLTDTPDAPRERSIPARAGKP